MSVETPVAPVVASGRFRKPALSLGSTIPTQIANAPSQFPSQPGGLVLGGTLHFQPFERIDIADILLRPQGKSIRPGGDAKTPKPFSLHSQRQIRYKKVGVRRMYSIKQILSVRDAHKKFPFNTDAIANVFEEGLGEEIGRPKMNEFGVIEAIVEEEKLPEPGMKLSERGGARPRFRNSRKPESDSKDDTSADTSSVPSEATSASETPRRKKSRWVPPSLRVKHGGRLDPLEVLERSIRSILNKITLDTFDDLAPRVVVFFEDEVTNAAGLYKLVSLIFEKTVQEPLFGPLYAGVCVALSKKEKKLDVTEKQEDGTDVVRQMGFKQALLQQCQREFEKGKREVVIKSNMTKQDIDEAQIKQKGILIGTIQFIGQLYLVDLLTSSIIQKCIIRLLNQGGSEEDIECVCELLRNVGKKLDDASGIAVFYQRLQNIAKDKSHSKRIQFMARNLLELRERNWSDDIQKQELRKKQEIRKEFEQEKGGGGFRRTNVPTTSFEDTDTSQVLDSGVDIGIKFGIKKYDADVIGVDATATEKLRHEPSLGINFHHRYGHSRQARVEPEQQKLQNRANRKERHRNFLLKSRDVSVNVVAQVQTKARRRPTQVVLNQSGRDVELKDDDKVEFETKIMELFDNYVQKQIAGLSDTMDAIRKLADVDRSLLVRKYFETVAQAMGEARKNGASLIYGLLDQGFVSEAEFINALNEFFEFIVDMELDCPNVFENCAFILAQLFDDGCVQMKQLHVLLSKDPNLSKWYRRVFDRNPQEMQRKSEEASHGFKKQHRFVAKIVAELGKLNGDNTKAEIQSVMSSQGFDLSVYVSGDQMHAFVEEFELQEYLDA